jgi:TetR/AcrR family transcriptional regulator, transcriptional repressor of aconitase
LGNVDLRAIFERMIVWTTSGRGDAWLVALQLLVRAATDRPLAAVIQKRYARFRRKLATLIERWQSEGVVRSAVELFAGTEKETHNENANPGAAERLNDVS